MTENEKYNIVQSNQFIQETQWNMKIDTLKIFKLLISRIDTKNPPKDNTIQITKKEILNILEGFNSAKKYDLYTYARSRLKDLITGVKVYDDENREIYVSLIQKVIWEKKNEVITCKFSEEVIPYLIVANRFLQYPVENIRGFRSKYGIIFYENLYSRQKQYQTGQFTISIDKLRYITDTEKKYPRFDNWERNVLKAGIDDLNKSGVEILVKYEKVKDGRNVSDIIFFIRKRTSYKETKYEEVLNPSFLIRNNDDVIETKASIKQEVKQEELNLFDDDVLTDFPF